MSKYKHLSQQTGEQLDALQKDKRRISDELETNTNQLLESTSRLTDLERKLKTIEADRQLLQNELDDSRDVLQLELQRNQNLQSQMEKLKADTDKKLADKDDEVDLQRASHRRQLESAQAQLEENESRHKSDLNSFKKKHQTELEELRSKYESAKKARTDAENQQKKLQQTNKVFFFFFNFSNLMKNFINVKFQDLLDKLTEEQHMHDATQDQLSSSEKRATSYRADMEESKSLLERVTLQKQSKFKIS